MMIPAAFEIRLCRRVPDHDRVRCVMNVSPAPLLVCRSIPPSMVTVAVPLGVMRLVEAMLSTPPLMFTGPVNVFVRACW